MVCMGMLSSVRGVVRCRLGVAVDGPVGQYRPRVWVCLVDLTSVLYLFVPHLDQVQRLALLAGCMPRPGPFSLDCIRACCAFGVVLVKPATM